MAARRLLQCWIRSLLVTLQLLVWHVVDHHVFFKPDLSLEQTFTASSSPCFLVQPRLDEVARGPHLLVLVHSSVDHTLLRHVLRSTWAGRGSRRAQGWSVTVVFVVGVSPSRRQNDATRVESDAYGDVLVVPHLDTYRNLTRKFLSGLSWASRTNFTYLLKTDDDVVVDVPRLLATLDALTDGRLEASLLCYSVAGSRPYRAEHHRWHVSPDQYPGDVYPRHCYGVFVGMSKGVVAKLLRHAAKATATSSCDRDHAFTSYFSVDDVYVTGILAKQANISHTHCKYAIYDKAVKMHRISGALVEDLPLFNIQEFITGHQMYLCIILING